MYSVASGVKLFRKMGNLMAPETQTAVLPRRSIIHKADQAALALLLVAIGLACASATYQVVGTWRDADRFHQQGHSVQARSVNLNMDCYGQGPLL